MLVTIRPHIVGGSATVIINDYWVICLSSVCVLLYLKLLFLLCFSCLCIKLELVLTFDQPVMFCTANSSYSCLNKHTNLITMPSFGAQMFHCFR